MNETMKKTVSLILMVLLIIPVISFTNRSVNAAKTDVIFGDINGDNLVSNTDFTLIKNYRARLISFSEEQKILADVDGDGSITITDLRLVESVAESSDYSVFPIYDLLTDSGYCGNNGDNLKYLLKKDNSLIIFGTGEMDDYSNVGPWGRGTDSIIIKSGVTSIGKKAFYYSTGLHTVEIADSVSKIGTFAFGYCSSITEFAIPLSVISIGNCAFCNCTGLTDIMIPASVKDVGEETFRDCSGLNSIQVDPDNTVYDSRDNCNAIIKTANNHLLSGCKNTSIPDTVTRIGIGAFYGCTSLTEIIIPYGVDGVEDDAFFGCTSLNKVSLPTTMVFVGNYSFYNCSQLKSITIPDSVSSINYKAFGYHNNGKTEDFTVYGCLDSEAERYANDNSLAFVSIPSQRKSISSCAVLLSPTTFEYDGTPKKPSVTVKDGSSMLVENNDYIVEYTNNTDIGIGYAIILGRGYYKDSITAKFIIKAAETQPPTEAINCEEIGLQHAWSLISNIPPFCTTDGSEEYVCTKCAATKTETLKATGHTKGDWETVDEPTDTEEGLRVRKCTVCGTVLESEAVPISVSQPSGKIVAESVTGRIGETVDVKISIEDNPGITSLQLKVDYSDDDLELTQIIDNSLFNSPISHSKLTNNPVKISWFSGLSDDNDENGAIATLRFRLKPGAKDSTITLSYDQANIFNISGQEIPFNTFAGTVSVDNTKVLSSIAVSKMPTKTVYEIGESLDTAGLQLKLIYSDGSVSYATSGFNTSGFNSASEGAKMVTVNYQGKTVSFEVTVNPQAEQPTCSDDSPKFLVGSATGKPGETVDIKVSIENNPSITALQVKIGYSSEDLELTEIIDNSLFDSPISHSKYLTANPQTISWHSTNSDDLSDNGTFVTLRFKLKPGAKDSSVTLSYKKSNVFNSSFDEFDFQVVNGMVYVMNSAIMLGDVDGDGNVEIRDATWIQRHVALMEIPIEAHKATADVDGDGEITLMDATSIQRYLANLKSNDKIGKLLAG